MAELLTLAQLTGRDDSHLIEIGDGHRLHPEAAAAFARLQADATEAGFALAIASSFRGYQRQLAIFNGKACGERPVHDDRGRQVAMAALDAGQQLAAILRYSALPGASRHHWGTDLDVYDAAAVAGDYRVQLSPEEVAPGGVFEPLHRWLDARMAAGESRGFYRPYGADRGGVAPERWHLSYAPLSLQLEGRVDAACLRACWGDGLLLRETVETELAEILERFVRVAPGWCPLG